MKLLSAFFVTVSLTTCCLHATIEYIPWAISPGGDKAFCGHGTSGWTSIDPLVWTSAGTLADPESSFDYEMMLNAWFSNQFPGYWTYELDDTATGKLSVGYYSPFDGPRSCEHGARIRFNVDLSLPAGQTFQWIQYYSYAVTANSVPSDYPDSGEWIMDPPVGYTIPPSNEAADEYPFYDNLFGKEVIADDLHFFDRPATFPRDSDVPHSGSWDYTTLLVSWDGSYSGTQANPERIHVYGALEWGYSYLCKTPETANTALLLVVSGLGCALLRFRRRCHGNEAVSIGMLHGSMTSQEASCSRCE